MSYAIAIIAGAIFSFILIGFYSFIQPVLNWFISITSQTPLLTDLVPEAILNGIKILSLLLLAGFLVYGIITAIAGKTLGFQSELTPGRLFVRIALAILIIALSYSSHTIHYSDLPLSENRNIRFCLVDILIGFSNKLVETISVRDEKTGEKISAVTVLKQQLKDIEKVLGENDISGIDLAFAFVLIESGLVIQAIVIFIACLFLIATIIRFLVFWIKRIALIVIFGSIIPIAAILLILPGTSHYAKLIFKKLILDIFVIFLVVLTLSFGAYIVGNEKLSVELFNLPNTAWIEPIFRLVLLISFFMLSLKIPYILDRAVGVDLGAFALTIFATGYLARSVSWAKGKYDNYKEKNIKPKGVETIGKIGSLGGKNPSNKGPGGAGSYYKKEPEIASREYTGSLKNAPKELYKKWFTNWVNDTNYAPSVFMKRARSYVWARQDPVKMSNFRDKFPEIKRKLDTAHSYYFLGYRKNLNVKKYREKFEK